MKRLYSIIAVFALALTFWACESYLEEELTADVSAASYYTTEAGLEDAVRAIYPSLKEFFGQEEGGTFTVFGTDEFTNGADGGYKGFNFYDTRLNPDDNFIEQLWQDFYYGINQANAVLNRSQDIEMDETRKLQRQAEARFLRAFMYFTLVRTYGDVHLTLEETEGVETESNRTSAAEVYNQAIIPDLQFALQNLPAPADQPDYGRPHTAAVEFLLAKVHLTRAYTDYAESNDFQQAATYMENVINNYNYSLVERWGDLWALDNQLNSEVVWAIQNTTDQLVNGRGNRFHLYFLMEYDKLQGMQRDTENGRPWKRFRPTPWLLNLWNRDIDRRYDEGFKHVWYANNEGSIPTDGSGNLLYNLGDSSVFIPGPGRRVEQDEVDYLVINPEDYTERVYPTMNKYIDPTRPDRQWTNGSRDWVPMRLADAYLIAAEAHLMMGDVAQATEYVNVIRERAAWDGMEDAMTVDQSEVDIDFILDERARELTGEMHRWWDLARIPCGRLGITCDPAAGDANSKLVERVRLHNPEGGPNIQNFHRVRPIPREQIDKSTNPIEQNPEYSQ